MLGYYSDANVQRQLLPAALIFFQVRLRCTLHCSCSLARSLSISIVHPMPCSDGPGS